MENINGQNDLSKIAEQYRSLHSQSGTDEETLNSLDDKSIFELFQKDMEDGKLDGQHKTNNGNESIFNGFSQQVMYNIDDFINVSPELKNGIINELAIDAAEGENIYLWKNPETGKYESNPKFKDLDFETFRTVMTRAEDIKSGRLPSDSEELYNATAQLDKNGNIYASNVLNDEIRAEDKGNGIQSNFVNKYHDEKSAELENLANLGYKVLDETAEYSEEWQAANAKSEAMQAQITNLGEQLRTHQGSEPVRSNFASDAEYNHAKSEWEKQGKELNQQMESATEKFNEHEIARNQIIWEANEGVAGEDKTVITRADSPEIVQYKMARQKLDVRSEIGEYKTKLSELNELLADTSYIPDKQKISVQIQELESKLKTAQTKLANFGGSEDDAVESGFMNKYHDAKSAQLENLFNQGYKVLDETATYNADWRAANSRRDDLETQLENINTQTKASQKDMPQRENFATEEEYTQAHKEWSLKNAALSGLFDSIKSQLTENENSRMQIISDANASVTGDDKTVITRADTPEIIMMKMAQQRQDTQNEIKGYQQQLSDINKARTTNAALSTAERADLDAKAADIENKLKAAQERFAKFGTNHNIQ